MNITEAIKIAFLSLWANKLRSALTLLGVVIGVAAVIAVVTFVNGINGYVAEKIFNLGADVFIMFKVSPAVTNIDHYIEGQKRKDLTMDDYRAVREGCKLCAYVGAYARNNTGHVKYGERRSDRHHRAGDDALGRGHARHRHRFRPHAGRVRSGKQCSRGGGWHRHCRQPDAGRRIRLARKFASTAGSTASSASGKRRAALSDRVWITTCFMPHDFLDEAVWQP